MDVPEWVAPIFDGNSTAPGNSDVAPLSYFAGVLMVRTGGRFAQNPLSYACQEKMIQPAAAVGRHHNLVRSDLFRGAQNLVRRIARSGQCLIPNFAFEILPGDVLQTGPGVVLGHWIGMEL